MAAALHKVSAALILILSLTAYVVAQVSCETAPSCDHAACHSDPDCFCSGIEPNIALQDRPQILYLTFDDSLTDLQDQDYYQELFGGAYTNPNGCEIRGTFFLSHMYTEYPLVNLYYSQGHEIASHSVSHKADQPYWQNLNAQGWRDEMTSMRDMIAKYALVPKEEVIGMRAPFLQGGGNEQFQMLVEDGYTYDSTMPSLEYGYTNLANGRWPHSLDYASTMDCTILPCPTCSFPGVWSQPMLNLEDQWYGSVEGNDTIGSPCSMLDGCDIIDNIGDPDEVYDMMMKNFLRSYNGNTRAPLGFYVHAAWFFGEENMWRFIGYKRFIEEVLTLYKDVWIVPVKSGIEYTKSPVPSDQLQSFEPFGCANRPAFTCDQPQECRYTDPPVENVNEIYMSSCIECPPNYPWIGNPEGI
jgi:hypothetical protein